MSSSSAWYDPEAAAGVAGWPEARRRNRAFTPRAPGAVLRLWRLVRLWYERDRQRNALAKLDDRMLRDIGITRVDAMRECRKPFWR
jgi:uncharacterized protein YjiS (DUF1127 family)